MRRRPSAPASHLDVAELEHRARYGGWLWDIPPLTQAEQERWDAIRRSRPDWVPQRALHYAWARVDPNWGRGGECHSRHFGSTDGWTLDGFLAALREDEQEIAEVVALHPAQEPRLRQWHDRMTVLGHGRERDPDGLSAGEYYERLHELGYDCTQ